MPNIAPPGMSHNNRISLTAEEMASENQKRISLRNEYGLDRDSFQRTSGYCDGKLSGLLDLRNQRLKPGTPMVAPEARMPIVSVNARATFKAKEAEDLYPGLTPTPAKAIDHLRSGLRDAPNPEVIAEAHHALVKDRYQFVGYHGTNKTGSDAILNGMNPARIGTGGGTDKGQGFYVARHPDYAKDYSESASQDPESVDMKTGKAKAYEGDDGTGQVVRVYVRHGEAMRLQKDTAWGVESSSGDPNHDKRVKPGQTDAEGHDGLKANAKLTEIVISPRQFGNMAAIPSFDPKTEKTVLNSGKAIWPSHEI